MPTFPPVGARGGAASADDAEADGRDARPWQFIPLRTLVVHAFYNWRAVLLVAAFPALAGIAAALFIPTQYTAESTLIVFVGRDNADVAGLKAVNLAVNGLKEVNSEIDIIRSGDVATAALRKIGPATLFPSLGRRRWLGLLPPLSEDEAVRAAQRDFEARIGTGVQTDTNIVRVSFIYPDRTLAIATLRVIVQAYLAHRRDLFTNPTSSFLRSQLDDYTARLQEVDARIEAVKRDNQVLDIKQDIATAGGVLASLQQRRDQLRERRQAALAEAEAAGAKLAVLPREVLASRDQTNQVSNDDSRNTLLRLQVERDHLAAGYRAEYPAVRELDSKIASARAGMNAVARSSFYSTRNERNPAFEQMQTRMLAAQVEASALAKPTRELESQIDEARRRTAELRAADGALLELERTREVIVSNYRQFALREAGARIDEDATRERNANVRLVQDADSPYAGSNTRWHFLAAGLFAAVMFGLGAGVLMTVLRRTFVLPEEAERHLGIPALADIAMRGRRYDTPAARREIAGLASLLLDERAAAGETPILQFVSEDATSLAIPLVRALAREFAAGHGLRVLIVDLQTAAKTNDNPAGRDAAVTVRETDIMNVWFVPNAPSTVLGSSRALLAQLRQLLDGLRRQHDVVLVVGPAETGQHASRRLARIVDLNVLVLRADHTRAPVAEGLCASLASVGAEMRGFVLAGRRAYVPRAVLRWL